MTFKARISPHAQRYIRNRAEDLLTDTCRITRPTPAGLDPVTNVWGTQPGTVIYEGPCRLWELTSSMSVTVGEENIAMGSTMLSLPWDITPLPEMEDLVEIVTSDEDPDVVGRTGVLGRVARGGNLRATRRYTVRMDDSTKEEW